MRKLFGFASAVFAAALVTMASAIAHHGWDWTEDEQTEMTGTITEIYIGPPHPRLMIDTPDGPWQVDLGNPRQTRDAGFVEGEAEVGDQVLIRGHRSNNSDERIIKAVRATINDTQYTFYPNLLQED
ncbi:DUF6152 family protein [Aliidiomarina maris]|uniref:DUF5666 domain-containing protein n=1 Tax=Aliidiomarina maris TaxID=531312 RepID=A0A327WPX1_9GAMM|nr:DUF6152 family protein [Aliidiomarina maris]MCL5050580.1 DUF6152 family protein [Bacillota bacterium]RAJ93278.1 hypothetical protein B0I24_1205 [Aliidiomarina maris]RUO18534.1 hypothetical protein CWE07_13625 [Aliidiomarina maris]